MLTLAMAIQTLSPLSPAADTPLRPGLRKQLVPSCRSMITKTLFVPWRRLPAERAGHCRGVIRARLLYPWVSQRESNSPVATGFTSTSTKVALTLQVALTLRLTLDLRKDVRIRILYPIPSISLRRISQWTSIMAVQILPLLPSYESSSFIELILHFETLDLGGLMFLQQHDLYPGPRLQ
jgi:hypothetical protein